MSRRALVGTLLLVVTIAGTVVGLVAWKYAALQKANAAAASQPEPMESVTVASAKPVQHRDAATSIGTVIALRSITLRNELAGTVRHVAFAPGQIVESGAILVTLDVSVEEAELKAQEAQAALAETLLGRVQRASQTRAASEAEVDKARAERDVALAQIARTRAVIARKTIRAPFRARAGLADVHPGQYLNEGTQITTLQGVDDAVHVDFAVAQQVAEGLRVGQNVEVFSGAEASRVAARIIAIDARVDPATRNALVRAKVEGRGAQTPAPGSSVRVRVPVGVARPAVAIPVTALRKGPGGDHVFVIAPDKDGKTRAHLRQVESGAIVGDEIVVQNGLTPGEQVAASGSFKLRDAALVAVTAGGR